MARLSKRLSKCLFFVSTMVSCLFVAVQVQATLVEQLVQVSYEGPGGTPDLQDTDSISGATSTVINRDIFASLNTGTAILTATAGRFGNVAASGEVFNTTDDLQTHIEISSDEYVNLTGVPQRATANFIIDGGSIDVFFAPDLDFGYLLTVQFDIRDVSGSFLDSIVWQSGGFLQSNGVELVPLFTGKDIGATADPNAHGSLGGAIDIPLSFQKVELGIIPPDAVIDIEYVFQFQFRNPTVLEGLFFEFSDPGNIEGVGDFPTIAFEPIPEPASATLLGLMGLIGVSCRPLVNCRD